MEGINPILKGSVERYLKKAKYPNLEDVCAILGIGEEEEEAKLDVGDEISFVLKNGVAIRALAVKKELDGMLFCSLNCLPERIAMSESGECDSYEESEVREYLRGDIFWMFPENIKESLVPFENGDFLRIPTEKEIFGKNTFGEEEPESVTQWEPMKRVMNRVAGNSCDESTIWYWLKNESENSSSGFAFALNVGTAGTDGASTASGVRPVFKIKIQNLTALCGECKGE